MKDGNQYSELGVSSKKDEVHNAIKKLDKGLFPGAFCKICVDNLTGSEEHCLTAHADGAGTKASLAYLYWKETGDISALANLATDAIVMNMDDMICVGATGPFTFTQNLDRNKFRIPGEAIEAIINCAQDFFDRMRNDHGIDISYNGGETADVNDLVRTLTVNASMQARMLRADVIDTKIKAGNVIVGLASDGRSSYEDAYNSGIGSNGLTALRHKLFGGAYTVLYPETYEGLLLEKKLAYTGQYRVTSLMPMADGSKIELGKLALSPTRTYAPIIKKMLAEIPKESISAMIHCSGGGQGKCLGFADGNVHIVKDSLFPTPSLFSLIQSESKETWENMYTTFNMGHRFEVYCDNAVADQIINISKSFKVDAKIVGYVEAAAETSLTIKSSYGDFDYVPEEK